MKPLITMSLGCSAAVAACTLDSEPLQPTALAGQECPTGQYMAGVGTDGHIICRQSINGFAGGAVTGTSSFDRVGIGTATPTEALHVRDGNARFQGAGKAVIVERNSDDAASHNLLFEKSRGTAGAPAGVHDGDLLGSVGWLGYDGADFMTAVQVQGFADGVPTAGRVPGGLRILMSPPAGGPVGVVYIRNNGAVGIGTESPEEELHIRGDILLQGTGGDGGRVVLASTAAGGHQYELYVDGNGPGTLEIFDRTANRTRLSFLPDGRVGIGTNSPNSALDINGDSIRLRLTKVPAMASSPCSVGEISWGDTAIYVCVANNQWKKANLATF